MVFPNNARNISVSANNRQKDAVKGRNSHVHKKANKTITATDIVAITNEEEVANE